MSNIIKRLGEFIKAKDISIRAFEMSIGASNGSIGRAITKNKDIGISWLSIIIEKYPDLNTDWLLTGRGNIFATKIPEKVIKPNDTFFDNPNDTFPKFQKRLSNNDGMEIAEQQVPVYESMTLQSLDSLFSNTLKPNSYLSLPNLPKCDGAVRMWGDSMSPELQSGDLLVYKKVKDLRNGLFLGQIYLLSVEVEGEEYIMVQYVERSDTRESVKLVSKNERYPPKDVPLDSIKAMAMIRASVRYRSI